MSLDLVLEQYPKEIELKGSFACTLRPLESQDEIAFHEFFLAVPTQERMFIKHRVTEPEVIHEWCQNIDLGRNLPLLACRDGQIVGDATLHQQLGDAAPSSRAVDEELCDLGAVRLVRRQREDHLHRADEVAVGEGSQ